jgi:hypothetical protein
MVRFISLDGRTRRSASVPDLSVPPRWEAVVADVLADPQTRVVEPDSRRQSA